MRKGFIATVFGVALTVSASAGAEPVFYGNVHLSLNKIDIAGNDQLRVDSHSSSLGVKGGIPVLPSTSFIYKFEFGYDTTDWYSESNYDEYGILNGNTAITDRDQWLGFASRKAGTLRMGVISTSYKTSGAAVDPLYRTIFEGRGFLGQQSRLHDGAGENGGRSVKTARYDSPSVWGVKAIAHYAKGEESDETVGGGLHYEGDMSRFYIDSIRSNYLMSGAIKMAGQLRFESGWLLGAQYETGDSELLGADKVMMANVGYVTGNTAWVFSYGKQQQVSKGFMLAFDHKLSKSTDIYAGYGVKNNSDSLQSDDNAFAVGWRYSF